MFGSHIVWTPAASICRPLILSLSLSPFDVSVKMFSNWLLMAALQEERRGHRVCSSLITESSLIPDAAKYLRGLFSPPPPVYDAAEMLFLY